MKKRKCRNRVTAMAMAVIMAASLAVPGAGGSTAVYAAEQSAAVKFPDVYTLDLVQPIDDDEIVNEKVEALIRTMTTEEKYTFLGGNGTGDTEGNAGYLKGVPRLGVPMIKMYDGPAGVLYTEDTTNPPQEQMLAATWDESMAELYGEAVGKENVAIGGCFLLGAQLDIQRIPQFGRTKDQMGEDSYLLSSMADDLVEGMQENGGIAVLKHYAAFAQNATPGTNTNVEVSEQALHETYLPGFESAVKEGNALGIMSSYNKINGTAASANTYLQLDVLRDMWGYEYFTITDWGGNSGYTLNKGTDIEMPSLNNNRQEQTDQQVADGNMTREEADAVVDDAVRHVLKAYGKGGYLTLVQVDENGYAKEEPGRTELIQPGTDNEALAALYEESNAAVQKVAEEGGVLLKNENNTLPLDTSDENTVAVVGLTGMHLASGIGGERSYGAVKAMTSPYEALTDLVGEDKVDGQVYSDIIGTPVPNANLYTSLDGTEHGAVRTYGTAGSPGTPIVIQGQTIYMGAVDPTPMEGHEVGEMCATDEIISFTTGTKTYVNGENGNAFDRSTKPAYTWTTYIEAPESGEYTINYNNMGASGNMKLYSVDAEGKETSLGSVSSATANQGTQYYSSIVPTETGMNVGGINVTLEAGKRYKVVITAANKVSNKDMQVELAWITPSQKKADHDNAIKAAEENDTVVVFAYAKVSDPADTREKTTLKLSADQQNMILEVAEAAHAKGNKVAVVLNNDSAVVMEDWIDEVDAILEMYYPGQRGGVATAKLLTGEVNPSGKLAYTIPKKDTDTIITYSDEAWERFEQLEEGASGGGGMFGAAPNTTYMDEGINTGYRWYDEMGIEPQYDFGYGLSYTTFEYGNMEVSERLKAGESAGYDVSFTVTNTGDVAGSEVAQIYLGEAQVPEGIQTSKYQLAGYEKVKDLQPGETREVTIHVSERSLSYWNSNQEALNVNSDGTKDKWTVAEGKRTIYAGAASDDLRMSATVNVKERAITQEDLDKATEEAKKAQEKAEEAQKAAEEAQKAAEAAKNAAEKERAEAEKALAQAKAEAQAAQKAYEEAAEALKKAQEAAQQTTVQQPEKVTVSKVTQKKPVSKKKKQAQISWNTVSGASGYEISYSLKSNMSNAVTKAVAGGSKTKAVLKKLKSGKKYYVRVRAYKTVNGEKIYGSYSSKKQVKVK